MPNEEVIRDARQLQKCIISEPVSYTHLGLKMTYYEEILEAVRHKAILTCEEVAKFIVISDYKPMVKRDLTPTQEKLQNIWMAIVLAKEDRSFEAVEFIEKVVDEMD